MQDELNLVQKLAKIRSMSDVVVKGKKGYNYTYADITEILANITAGMKRYGVSLIPMIVPGTSSVQQTTIVKTKFDKTAKAYDSTSTEMLYSAEMVFKWVNDNDISDVIEVPWFVTGSQEDPSQAFGSGLTYCIRYFLTSYFQIAQPETDVDAYRSKQKAASVAEDKALADEIIGDFDTKLKSLLTSHPEKADEIKKFITGYVKSANYFTIKEPALAAKLRDDFERTFIGGSQTAKQGGK